MLFDNMVFFHFSVKRGQPYPQVFGCFRFIALCMQQYFFDVLLLSSPHKRGIELENSLNKINFLLLNRHSLILDNSHRYFHFLE